MMLKNVLRVEYKKYIIYILSIRTPPLLGGVSFTKIFIKLNVYHDKPQFQPNMHPTTELRGGGYT
jgi:hypothetical protein